MLNCLNKTIKKLDIAQEECTNLIRGISNLLENTSGADIAVVKKPLDEIVDLKKVAAEKAKALEQSAKASELEAKSKREQAKTVKTNNMAEDEDPTDDVEEPDMGDVEPDVEEPDTEPVDDVEANEEPEDVEDQKEAPEASIAKIRRSLNALEDDGELSEWVNDYFVAKMNGNLGEASFLKKKIDERIKSRDFDKETIYHGKTKRELISDKGTEGTE